MEAPKTLAELIDLASTRNNGASGRQLAFQAQKQGYAITPTTLNAMRAGSYKSTPKAETLRGIAWLAGVPAEVAFTAAGQPVPGPPIADELPDGADRLSAKSRRVLIEMARVLVDLEARTDDTTINPNSITALVRGTDDAGSGSGQEQKINLDALARASLPNLVTGIADAIIGSRFDGSPSQWPILTPKEVRGEVRAAVDAAISPDVVKAVPGLREDLARDVFDKVGPKFKDYGAQAQKQLDDDLEYHQSLEATRMEEGLPPAEHYDLAAHPPMDLARDRWDAAFGATGEENQDPGEVD